MATLKTSFFLLLAACSVLGRHEPKTRVVGGKDAPEGLVPYQVALKMKNNHTFCGGAVISDRWILTAAHCVEPFQPSEIIAVVGTLSKTEGGTTYEISKTIPHEDHDPDYYKNDIAVISTKKPIEFTKNVQPLALPKKDTPGGISCIVSGWGKLGLDESPPDKLQYLYVNTLTGQKCNKYFDDDGEDITVDSKQICTLNKKGEGICQGDSGGSLVCNGTAAGVVSFNWPCANNFPDVYANTFAYVSWIEKNTESP